MTAPLTAIGAGLLEFIDPNMRPHSIHFVGDVHWGRDGTDGDARRQAFMDDSLLINGEIAHRVYVGDLIETPANAGQIAQAVAMVDALNPGGVDGGRVDLVAGNHDYASTGTAATFLANFGYSDRRWIRDLAWCRIIGLTSDHVFNPWMTLETADLDWLDDRLGETALPCIIVYHAPLYGTVTTDAYTSLQTHFFAYPDASIRAVLGAHDNALLWVSGHTHTPNTDPDMLTAVQVGSRWMQALNCSSIGYVGSAIGVGEPLYSPVVSLVDGRFYVRWRDHWTGTWQSINDRTVALAPRLPQSDTPPATAIVAPGGSVNLEGSMTPTVAGDVTTIAGLVSGDAWGIDGDSTAVSVPIAATGINELSGAIAWWVKRNSLATTDTLGYFGSGAGSGQTTLSVNAFGNGTVQVYCRTPAGVLATLPTIGTISDTSWHLVHIGWDATTVHGSIDAGTIHSIARPDHGGSGITGNAILGGHTSVTANALDGLVGPAAFFGRPIFWYELNDLVARRAGWTLGVLA